MSSDGEPSPLLREFGSVKEMADENLSLITTGDSYVRWLVLSFVCISSLNASSIFLAWFLSFAFNPAFSLSLIEGGATEDALFLLDLLIDSGIRSDFGLINTELT